MSVHDTKEKILDAAEKLFAERGFAATSMRNITAEADVNLAAVNYHFGSKESLAIAVFQRRLGPVNLDRLRLLDEAEARAGDGPLAIEEVLRAFLSPTVRMMKELGEAGTRFMKLVGRTHSEANDAIRQGFLDQFRELIPRYESALRRALPHLEMREIHRRMHFVVGAMAHTLAWGRKLALPGAPETPTETLDEVLDSMIAFTAAGMRAPTAAVPAGGRASGRAS